MTTTAQAGAEAPAAGPTGSGPHPVQPTASTSVVRALDLYSCSGGAAWGYNAAGLEVARGVDIVHRPRYPFPFTLDDAIQCLLAHGRDYDFIHASPPCQSECSLTVGTNRSKKWGASSDHIDLVGPTRRALDHIGVPYVIEQPIGKAKIRKDLTLCGEMYGLGVIRHRDFELGFWKAPQPAHIPHRGRVRGWRHGQYHDGPYVAVYGDGGGKGTVREWQDAMGIHWTDVRKELAEAIPPAYAQYIGEQFLAQAREQVAA